MKYIPFEIHTGKDNMDIDEKLLNSAIESKAQEPIFRLYGWSPACVSLGRNQDESFLDKKFLTQNGIDVVRRLTGGRALLHDNEITYSFICPTSYLEHGENVALSYRQICELLIEKFKKLDIELEFGSSKPIKTGFDYCMLISTGADLCYKNKKLIGSAQCRKNGYILQHGSILYDCDDMLLENIFKEKVYYNEITTIKEINPSISMAKIIEILSD